MPETTYEVRISGLVPEEALEAFGDVNVTTTGVSTVLSGTVDDQSALLGLLARLRELGLEVIEVHRVLGAEDDQVARASAAGYASSVRGDAQRGLAAKGGGTGSIDTTTDVEGRIMTDDLDQTGPIDYLVVEFPGNRMTGEAFPLLVDLVDRGIIRILDLAFVRRELDGSVVGLSLRDVDGDGELDLAVFEGAATGMLGDDDVQEAGNVLEPGSSAGILVYENVWAGPFAAAVRRAGGQLVASGRIPVQAVLAALDVAEPVS